MSAEQASAWAERSAKAVLLIRILAGWVFLSEGRTSAVLKPADFVVALGAFLALTTWKAPPWMVVIATALMGAGSNFLS